MKFEIYLPAQYTDTKGNKHELDSEVVLQLGDELRDRFKGFTESNRLQAPPFRGVWKSRQGISVDHLFLIYTLVPIDEELEAMKFFQDWKQKLEARLFQEFVLVMFSPIQVIGQL